MPAAVGAIYARLSFDKVKNGDTSDSVERQIDHAKAFLARIGVPLGPVFFDNDVSGATYAKLEGRKRMVAAAEAGAFQILVVSEQSRLGRDTIESVYTIKQIAECGVKIYCYLDNTEISVEDEVASAMTFLRGFASASERRQTSKRVYDSARKRVHEGHVAGAKIYGYDNQPVLSTETGRRLHVVRVVNEDQAAVVRRIFENYAAGMGSVTIKDALNAEGVPAPRKAWLQTTVRNILANELYRGEVIWNRIRTVVRRGKDYNLPRPESEWIRKHDKSLRIIDDDLWGRVQARRQERREIIPRSPKTGQLLGRPTWRDGHSEYHVTGFGRCRECDSSIRIETGFRGPKSNRVPVRVYVCTRNANLGTLKCSNNVRLPHHVLDRAIIASMTALLDSGMLADAVTRAVARLRESHTDHLDRRGQVERSLQDVQRKIDRLVDALADGTVSADEIKPKLKAETERKAALTAELAALGDAAKVATLDPDEITRDLHAKVADVRALLTESVPQARAMFRKLLDGPIYCEPIREPGRKGFRFRGMLTFKRLISGEAAILAGSPVASLTGHNGGDTCAANRARARRACGCPLPRVARAR